MRRAYSGLFALLLVFAAAPVRAELTCGDLRDLSTLLLQKHIRIHMMTPEVRSRAVEIYVERLDPQRLLYLEAEEQHLAQRLEEAFLEVRAGECTKLRAIEEDAVARARSQEAFVRGFLGADGYQVDTNAELMLDPDKRGWPKDAEQRDAWLRALLHFQASNFLLSGESLEVAKQRIVHRYELRTIRMAKLSRDDLYASYLDALANALDPHSSYLTQDALDDFQIQMKLSLEGIGVALSERDGYSVVEQVIPGGAADRVGALKPQDRIVAVADDEKAPVDIIDMPLRDVVNLIRGKKGTRVHLTVVRDGETTERFQVAIVRDEINLEEQAAKLKFQTVEHDGKQLKLAVIELPSFYGDGDSGKRQGSRDVQRLLEEAKREKAQGLLLDLSRNGGGLLDDAVRISGFFVRRGGIVAVQSSEERTRVLEDPDGHLVWAGPLVLLTSRVSASASEILAGAMKDYQRAVVVGDAHTFGKGTVQSLIPLRPGLGALKITTGLFFRPGGTSTQHTGVAADVVLPSVLTEDLVGERTQPNSLKVDGIESFVSKNANGAEGDGEPHFRPIDDPIVSELARRSHERVAGNEKFLEIERLVAKRKAENGVVRLSELLAEQEQEKAKNGGEKKPLEAAQTDDEGPTPNLDEALQVLADLVQLES